MKCLDNNCVKAILHDFFEKLNLLKCNRFCYMGHKQTLILLKVTLKWLKTTFLRQNDQFWQFLEKRQQVVV